MSLEPLLYGLFLVILILQFSFDKTKKIYITLFVLSIIWIILALYSAANVITDQSNIPTFSTNL